MSTESKSLTTFSEADAQRILARAAELEVTLGNRFTTEELRLIASKAGIDEHALEHAINETNAVAEPATSAKLPSPPVMKSSRFALLAATGALLGTLAVFADRILGGSPVSVFLPSGLFALYLALRHPVRDGFTGLVRELGVAFGSFTVAIAAMEGIQNASPAVTWSMLAGALACGVLSLRGARTNGQLADPVPPEAR